MLKAKGEVFSRLMNFFSSNTLHTWYQYNRRELPWRSDPTPYHIWLSEVILQQTRVAQGTAYYHRFIDAFPTVNELANAPEDQIMKLWQGLGYYNRARNLHAAAKKVANAYKGIFPADYQDLLQLPGVGPYTAAAIASIAFNLPHAVVDGNVIRVLTRLYGIRDSVNSTKVLRQVQLLADGWLDHNAPGDHNQAVMELGALVCTPKNPDCTACPLQHCCVALSEQTVDLIPTKTKKTKRSQRYLHYLVADINGKTALTQRGENDIWARLYEFPMMETPEAKTLELQELSTHFELLNPSLTRVNQAPKHVLTHQDLHAQFYHIIADGISYSPFQLVNFNDLHTFAVPRLVDRYLENYDVKDGKKRR